MAERPQRAQSPYLVLDGAFTQAFDYDGNGNVIYQGWAVPKNATKSEADWRICKMTYNGSNQITDIQWADGNEEFDNVWNDRASLSYT